ncbi:MAG: ABC-three component system middle component 2 [Solirubrobacteraceae bacterium]
MSGAVFNTPLESGLRSLFLLAAAGTRGYDTQSLVYLDYMLVHSTDVGGPASLHPESPTRRGELLVRRQLVGEGLDLMRSRDLIAQRFLKSGIVHSATAAGRFVADQFDSAYAVGLRERAKWVIAQYGQMKDKRLAEELRPYRQFGDDELITETRPDWTALGDG